jgi:molybdenum cofactor cytidylyltransferase
MTAAPPDIIAILLAGGIGARFRHAHGGLESAGKLQVRIANGQSTVGLSSAIHLAFGLDGIDHSLVVATREIDDPVEQMFSHGGFLTLRCERAGEGMGATLAQAVEKLPTPEVGYLIGLADMPHVKPSTIASVVRRLLRDEDAPTVVAPSFDGKRGNPVAFSRHYRDALLQLGGDQGARSVVASASESGSLSIIDVDDQGILRDIDVPADLD